MCTESLQANRDLLDPYFDGYKLSLDSLPTYSVKLESGVDEVKLRGDQYTLQHIKAFGIHNHLVLDQWNTNCVYYVDKQWKVIQHRVVLDSQLQPGRVVFVIADQHEKCNSPRHNVTLHFPTNELCVLADGVGRLYLLSTGNRDCATVSPWKILHSEDACGALRPFILLHSVAQMSESVDCLVLRIEEEEEPNTEEDMTDDKKPLSSFKALIDWLTITKQTDATCYQLSRVRKLKSKLAPFYAAIEATGKALYIASESEFTITDDSAKIIADEQKQEQAEGDMDTNDTPNPAYTWTQTSDDVTLVFILRPSIHKADIRVALTTDSIHVSIQNGEELLQGALYRPIDVQLCTWMFNNQKLEITLAKNEEGPMWTEVVIGNQCGEYVIDEDQARIIHERLAHLTSDQMNPDPIPGGSRPGLSPHDLEECDALPEGYSTWIRLDGDTHTVTNRVSLSSHQFLFNAQLHPDQPPCICLRHDVDGLLWQPGISTKEHPSPWQHTSTFNALGYVQASKRDRKYSSCAPNCSYAVICDCIRHLYVYRQPSAIVSPLRNRKSGRVVSQIAKQQLISLDSTEDIVGLAATDERIFTMTNSRLYVTRVTTQDS